MYNTIFKKDSIINATLKGCGQIVFQANVWSGILIILGLLVGNWQCAIGGVLGSLIGTLTASYFHFDSTKVNAGIYGFNASLVGIVLVFFVGINLSSFLFLVVGSFVTPLFQQLFVKRNFPVFTFPFILITWICYWTYNFFELTQSNVASFVPPFSYNTYFTGLNGFGQIVFQGSTLSGILIFSSIFIKQPFKAVMALIASILGAVLALVFHQSIPNVLMGLFGFNVILTTVALIEKDLKSILWTVFAISITLILNFTLIQFDFFNALGGVLTLPFVVGTVFVWRMSGKK